MKDETNPLKQRGCGGRKWSISRRNVRWSGKVFKNRKNKIELWWQSSLSI